VVRKRGEAGKDLEKVYRMICWKELHLLAYQNLYANKGALTPGIVPDDTVDGMSFAKIETIVDTLKARTYIWKPSRRTDIVKRDGKSKRPLGMPITVSYYTSFK
jgi:retron-type reverse transcriptase